jgi:hypothetical protein
VNWLRSYPVAVVLAATLIVVVTWYLVDGRYVVVDHNRYSDGFLRFDKLLQRHEACRNFPGPDRCGPI